MNALLFNTKHDIHMHTLFVDLEFKKVDKLSIDMIEHNMITLIHIINHRTSNDITTNFYCDFATRLKGCMSICDMLIESRYICGIDSEDFNRLVIYTFKKSGVYEFIAKDICKNIYKGDD